MITKGQVLADGIKASAIDPIIELWLIKLSVSRGSRKKDAVVSEVIEGPLSSK